MPGSSPKTRTGDRDPPGTLHALEGLSWDQVLGSVGFPQHWEDQALPCSLECSPAPGTLLAEGKAAETLNN